MRSAATIARLKEAKSWERRTGLGKIAANSDPHSALKSLTSREVCMIKRKRAK